MNKRSKIVVSIILTVWLFVLSLSTRMKLDEVKELVAQNQSAQQITDGINSAAKSTAGLALFAGVLILVLILIFKEERKNK